MPCPMRRMNHSSRGPSVGLRMKCFWKTTVDVSPWNAAFSNTSGRPDRSWPSKEPWEWMERCKWNAFMLQEVLQSP
eukprot:scaffold15963_cov69-Amphora_coffeaeformis.AAC.1